MPSTCLVVSQKCVSRDSLLLASNLAQYGHLKELSDYPRPILYLASRMSTCDSAKKAWSPPSLGAPCFLSIPADDVPRAKSFYEKVFDWTFKSSPDPTSYPEASFAMFYTPSPVLMGAIVKSGENSANTPGVGINIYLLVDDIEGTFEKAKIAGGSVAMEKVADGNHTLRQGGPRTLKITRGR